MIFKTSDKINKWVKQHRENCNSRGALGDQFVFEFIPSGIVEVQVVKCLCCGEEFTDYVD